MTTEHRIRHYVYGVAGDPSTLIPHESTMRGAWPCEARCSCGWETRTGGAVRSYIDDEVARHRREHAAACTCGTASANDPLMHAASCARSQA